MGAFPESRTLIDGLQNRCSAVELGRRQNNFTIKYPANQGVGVFPRDNVRWESRHVKFLKRGRPGWYRTTRELSPNPTSGKIVKENFPNSPSWQDTFIINREAIEKKVLDTGGK